jgi:hypothetical protein
MHILDILLKLHVLVDVIRRAGGDRPGALVDEKNDHSSEFEMEMVQLCNDHVKETFQGDRHGIINPARWSEASQWLTNDKKVGDGFGLDASIWLPPKQLLPGNELARSMLEDAKASAGMLSSKLMVDANLRWPSLLSESLHVTLMQIGVSSCTAMPPIAGSRKPRLEKQMDSMFERLTWTLRLRRTNSC